MTVFVPSVMQNRLSFFTGAFLSIFFLFLRSSSLKYDGSQGALACESPGRGNTTSGKKKNISKKCFGRCNCCVRFNVALDFGWFFVSDNTQKAFRVLSEKMWAEV